MADDWQVGDLALCVRDEDNGTVRRTPGAWWVRVGGVYRVSRVIPASLCCGAPAGSTLLSLEEDPNRPRHAWGSWVFRKIKPLSDDETREFKADLEQDQRVAGLEYVMQGIKWYTSWYIDEEGNTHRIDYTGI